MPLSPNQLRALLVAGVLSSIAPSPVEMLGCLLFPSGSCDLALHSADLQAELTEVAATTGPIFGHIARPGHLPVGWLWGPAGLAATHRPLSPGCGVGSSCPTLLGSSSPPAAPAPGPSGSSAGPGCPKPFFFTFTFLFLLLGPLALSSWAAKGDEEGGRAPLAPRPCRSHPSLTHQGQGAAGGARRAGLPVLPSILPGERPVPAGEHRG